MVKPVDRFARLFDPIEDIPGVVHEVMQLRAATRARCLSFSQDLLPAPGGSDVTY